MFGMKLDPMSNQPSLNTVRFSDSEIRSIVSEFVSEGQILTREDFDAIRLRAQTILRDHPMFDEEDAVKFALIDRAVLSKDSFGILEESITKNEDIVASLIQDQDLRDNQEFLKTILTKAEDLYTSGSVSAYTDGLFKAVEERVREYKALAVSGRIDKNGIVDVDVAE
jgi:hypothetical protein